MIKVSRRAILRGAGVALALPFLESLLPRSVRAGALDPPRRFLGYFVPNGVVMPTWAPAAEGADYELTPVLASLAPVKSKLLVLSGLANKPAFPDGDAGDHSAGTAAMLTAVHPVGKDGPGIRNGVSLDQVAAAALGAKSPLPSLQVGIDGGSSAGTCDFGYSCAYSRNISWATPTQPLPKLVSPQLVFDRLFSGYDPTETQAQTEKRRAYRTSVLDHSLGEVASLRGGLGASDQRKLDEYADGVRAVELRLAQMTTLTCQPGARPGEPADYPAQVTMMNDLMVLAMQCELTQLITFMLGNAVSNRAYPFLGIPEAHHELSHHNGDPAKIAKLELIDKWEIEQLADLLTKMDAVQEANGTTLLDNAAVFLSSDVSDGSTHAHTDLPVLVAGTAGGKLKSGRHVRYPGDPPIANLFATILTALGVPTPTFGDDGTGILTDLT
jgi:hypothetical protein